MYNPQLDADGKLKHLLTIEGLPKRILNQILDTAETFVGVAERDIKKVPLLRGKTVCNIFFENSTRSLYILYCQFYFAIFFNGLIN